MSDVRTLIINGISEEFDGPDVAAGHENPTGLFQAFANQRQRRRGVCESVTAWLLFAVVRVEVHVAARL